MYISEIVVAAAAIVTGICYRNRSKQFRNLGRRINSLEEAVRQLTQAVARPCGPQVEPEAVAPLPAQAETPASPSIVVAAKEFHTPGMYASMRYGPAGIAGTGELPAAAARETAPAGEAAAGSAVAGQNMALENDGKDLSLDEIYASLLAMPEPDKPAAAKSPVPDAADPAEERAAGEGAMPMTKAGSGTEGAPGEESAVPPFVSSPVPEDGPAGEPGAPHRAGPADYLRAIINFIRGGNIWVTGGVIMLLLGFAFLAQLGIFPIELRIAGAALAGMAMVGGGLYLRLKRPMYALILQGGGIGVLYLSAFASAKITTLLPPAAALVVMTALIIPAVALAILQNAQALALVGFLGGFAAPVLLSDGSGNYIALFSCYTLLNLGILAICRFRLWRWLNFAGALCTFVVMGYWGITEYDAAKFSTVEPYLLAFVLIYICITLESARRGDFSYSEPLDMILACSVPFIAAVFQWRLAADIPHGLSISAVAFGAFFILLSAAVWKLGGENYRRLAEFYLANGVVLANLAIPLELSGNLTATVWAVEGAALFFFACRIQSTRIKVVALLLQVVGMVAFFWDLAQTEGHTMLAASLISLAALGSACFHRLDAANPRREKPEAINAWLGDIGLERVLALVGLLWWYGGLALETARFADQPLAVFFGVVSVSALILHYAEKVTGLKELRLGVSLMPLATAAFCLLLSLDLDYRNRDSGIGYLLRHNFLAGREGPAWAAFAVSQAALLWIDRARTAPFRHAWWAGAVCLELLLMLTSSGRGAALDLNAGPAWGQLASIFPALFYVAALTWLLKRYARGESGLFGGGHARILGGIVPAALFLPLGWWLALSFFERGLPDPLPVYIPLLNPLEMQQILCIAIFAMWQRTISGIKDVGFALPLLRLLLLLDVLVFAWLHSMLFRSIFFFTGTPMGRAWDHASFQACLTVLWGVWGMGHLIIGHKARVRLLWVIGAGLMIADTAKLFLVDLADKGTLFRVISFFVMGGIFLLIGWLAPLPPSRDKEEQEEGREGKGDFAEPVCESGGSAPVCPGGGGNPA